MGRSKIARVLVLSNYDEQAFFERWDRGLSVWELRPLQIPSLDEFSFFEVVFIETDDLPLLTIILKQLASLPQKIPTLVCVSERNLGIVSSLKPSDFIDRAASSIELNLRIDRLIASSDLIPTNIVSKPLFKPEFIASTPISHSSHHSKNRVILDDLKFTKSGFGVQIGKKPVELTYREFELFSFLVNNPNEVFSREEVMTNVWGNDDMESSRVIDVHIRRIRSKLGSIYANYIKTVRSRGYVWSTEPSAEDLSD